MLANKPETVLYRAPTISRLLASHGRLIHMQGEVVRTLDLHQVRSQGISTPPLSGGRQKLACLDLWAGG